MGRDPCTTGVLTHVLRYPAETHVLHGFYPCSTWVAEFLMEREPIAGVETTVWTFELREGEESLAALHLHLPSLDVVARRVPGTRLPTCPVSLYLAGRLSIFSVNSTSRFSATIWTVAKLVPDPDSSTRALFLQK
jgi:hypothetical protein